MTLTTVLRGFKVPVAVLDVFLAANGLDETFGYPSLDPDASGISALLRTKMGTGGSNASVVFAQREILLDEDLPEEAPTKFITLREEVSSFARDLNCGTDGKDSKMFKMGLFVVFTESLSWVPRELQERHKQLNVRFSQSNAIHSRPSGCYHLSDLYFGVAASLKRDIPDLWFRQSGYPQITSGRNYTFHILKANYREHGWVYPPVPGQNKFVGSATSFDYMEYLTPSNPITNLDVHDLDDTWSFPSHNLPRNVPVQAWWLGKLADGTQIKPGKYVFRVAALAPFGNPHAADNWHICLNQEIEIVSE
ncbi:hypothetical protein S40293_08619 [Stachybotrys chartarum IBT 40293]|nr:hypothetical protein S40293_08619 [Stachybotrys chartarum IBT 40293]